MKKTSHDKLVIMRHLKDENALRQHGFDGPVLPSQDGTVHHLAERVLAHTQERDLKNVDIYSSPTERCKETTRLLHETLASYVATGVHEDTRLQNIDKGDIIIPDSYIDGEPFHPLREAYEAFWEQSFVEGDYTYRFGDPLCDGQRCVYPQLREVFSGYGECYAAFALRVYDFLYVLSQAGEEYHQQRQLVIIAHSASLGLMAETIKVLSQVSHTMGKNLAIGVLSKATQSFYDKMISKEHQFNLEEGLTIDFHTLSQPHVMEILAIERDVLRALLTQVYGCVES